jgi:hypothetical protein
LTLINTPLKVKSFYQSFTCKTFVSTRPQHEVRYIIKIHPSKLLDVQIKNELVVAGEKYDDIKLRRIFLNKHSNCIDTFLDIQ